MNILYLEWNSFCNEDMIFVLKELGHQVVRMPFGGYQMTDEEIARLLDKKVQQSSCDFLFSFNYFPGVSKYCKDHELKYVSWVYDSPHIHVYSYTIINSCNYVFLFDYAMYEEFHSAGIQTVYYMPLAVNNARLGNFGENTVCEQSYSQDISFVGSLYTEPKHRLYDKFQNMPPYAKGYLDGLISAQLHVRGYNFLREMLSEDIVLEMQKVYPTNPGGETVLPPEGVYADYVLARQVTAIERKEVLERLGRKFRVDLYTYDKNVQIPGVYTHGTVDYYTEMPYVFKCSKINLNITLRSIKTGIPLRALDIMGSGGFLLSNYQQELFEYFEPDKDFVYYSDYEELEEKVGYYLTHEKEREQIARKGQKKTFEEHSMKLRVQDMLSIVIGE